MNILNLIHFLTSDSGFERFWGYEEFQIGVTVILSFVKN